MLATQSVSKGYTVPDVQKKMPLHLTKEGDRPRLTLVGYPSGYILKPQEEDHPHMPEAEHLVHSLKRKNQYAAAVRSRYLKQGTLYDIRSVQNDQVISEILPFALCAGDQNEGKTFQEPACPRFR